MAPMTTDGTDENSATRRKFPRFHLCHHVLICAIGVQAVALPLNLHASQMIPSRVIVPSDALDAAESCIALSRASSTAA
jgi:hypothetical protein